MIDGSFEGPLIKQVLPIRKKVLGNIFLKFVKNRKSRILGLFTQYSVPYHQIRNYMTVQYRKIRNYITVPLIKCDGGE